MRLRVTARAIAPSLGTFSVPAIFPFSAVTISRASVIVAGPWWLHGPYVFVPADVSAFVRARDVHSGRGWSIATRLSTGRYAPVVFTSGRAIKVLQEHGWPVDPAGPTVIGVRDFLRPPE